MVRYSQVEGGTGLGALAAVQVNDAELGLELGNVVEEGVHQAFGVLRRHDDAVSDEGFGHTGQGGGEVDDEFAAGMGNDGQVGIGGFGHLGIQFQT